MSATSIRSYKRLSRNLNSGFTLVEILIVVVILGILAAIVIPQFTSASESAKASSLQSQLQTLRSQLELYQVQHLGNYPPQATFWDQMTTQTDQDGTAGTQFGPYLQKPISNPFVATANATDVTDAATAIATETFAASAGWNYHEESGTIRANIPNNVDAAGLGLDDSDDFAVQAGS